MRPTSTARAAGPGAVGRWEWAVPAAALAAVALWTAIALGDHFTQDAGLAYQAGHLAWLNGHPETLTSWDGTPTLAAGMGLVSRVMGESAAATVVTVVNGLLLAGLLGVAWWEVRRRAGAVPAAVVLGLGTVFAPAVSTVWWKQFNLISLALGVAAFALVRSRRPGYAGALLALSIAVKPVLVLLPVALLLRRATRAAAVATLAWLGALVAGAVALLAWRAHDLRVLDPISAYRNFDAKTLPYPNGWSCHTENFAPTSTLCRLMGADDWTVQRLIIAAFVLVLGAVAFDVVRGRDGRSWWVFAFASALSPMVSPLAWSHYQVMLAPLLVVVAVEVARGRPRIGEWATLAAGYALCELVWRPQGTLFGLIHRLGGAAPEDTQALFRVYEVSQFAQYVVFLAAVLVLGRRGAVADQAPVANAVDAAVAGRPWLAGPERAAAAAGTPGAAP
ncbi:MAG TPA: glycosyltransferase 87 family protein [Candidatus Dormibacteraeota bacterium]|nr:glycosyltransferase 87 family protein [Candidatus Dormibacteraeota bacterium]